MKNLEEQLDKHNIKSLFIADSRGRQWISKDKDIFNIEYQANSFGYRCAEFDKLNNDHKILFLGCSHTYGAGLPEQYIFSNLLSKKLNVLPVNLGTPGDSIMHQVRKAFWYFRNFGHPKTIIAVFPIIRMDLIVINGKNEQKDFPRQKNYSKYAKTNIEVHHFEQYSKAPHEFNNVIGSELAIYYSYIFLDILDQYCKSHNINFIWAAWEMQEYLDSFISKTINIPSDKNRISIKSLEWFPEERETDQKKFSCHKEFSDNILFNLAADRLNNPGLPHWGIHKNIHIAEEIYDNLISRGIYDN